MSETVPDWPFPPDEAPEQERLRGLAALLAEDDGPADDAGEWPERLWATLAESGAARWALPERFGARAIDREGLVRRYAIVSEGSLTAAFILTQHDAAVRRLAAASGPGRPRAEAILDRVA